MAATRREERAVSHFLRPGIGLGRRAGFALARHDVLRFIRRLALLIGALTALVLGGAAALSLFEDVSYWRGLMWALDTVATVGSIPNPESLGGDITKIVLISLGVGTMFFALVTLTELFVAGDLSGLLEAWRMERNIAQLENHYLICGFGRVGRQVARDLQSDGVPFVVIDDNADVREAIAEMEVLHVDGRASDDGVLKEAGIDRAECLIACVDSDAENIFATLTARQLRPDIHIVARAAEEASERKLMAAGANDVISPYKASGHAMAQLALDSDRGRQVGVGAAPGRKVVVSGQMASRSDPEEAVPETARRTPEQ
jgi:voltage-gated potassium channel